DEGAMRRLLIVEVKTVIRVPDGVDAFVQRHPRVAAAARDWETPLPIVSGRDRVVRERVQDVRQHQFLMLLLMVEPDLDQRGDFLQRGLARRLEESDDGSIDMTSVGGDVFDARPGQKTAGVAGVPRAGTDIIGIEEIGIIWV